MNISSSGPAVPDGFRDHGLIVRRGLGLRAAAFEQLGALLRSEGLMLAQKNGAFVKLNVQGVSGTEMGILAHFGRKRDVPGRAAQSAGVHFAKISAKNPFISAHDSLSAAAL